MTASGTYTADFSVDEFILEAWERCGKDPEILNGAAARSAKRTLQLMFLDWSNRGMNLWQVDQQSAVVLGGVATFTTPVATIDILEAWTRSGSTDTPLAAVSRDFYASITDKTSQGDPNQYWVERVNPWPVVHLYPVPPATTTIVYNRMRIAQDVGGLQNTLDAPKLWYEAICSNLAARMAVKFAPDRIGMLGPLAETAFSRAAGENHERVPFSMLPRFTR